VAIKPYLLYSDLEGALTFLESAFGFRREGEAMAGRDGKLRHAAMMLGDDVVLMGQPGRTYRNPKQLGQATQSLYVDVDDVDACFERARAAGAQILEEPVDTAYGQRRFGAADPEGHRWYFAQDIDEERYT